MISFKFSGLIFLLAFFCVFFIWLSDVLNTGIIPDDYVFISKLILSLHSVVFLFSLKMTSKLKVPVLSLVSFFSIINYGLVIFYIPSYKYQLGVFDYAILPQIFFWFLLFYCVAIFSYLNLRPSLNRVFQVRNDGNYLLLLIISMMFILSNVINIFISGFYDIAAQLLLGYLFVGFILKRNNMGINIFFISYLFYQIFLAAISGFGYAVVYIITFLCSLYLIFGFKSIRTNFLMFFLLVISVISLVVISKYKVEIRETAKRDLTNIEKIKSLVDLTSQYQSDKVVDDGIENSLLWRSSYQIGALSFIKLNTPSRVPFWYGESYFPLLYKFIPRIIWKNKPAEAMGQVFGHRYYITMQDDYGTSMNTPCITEAYMNFSNFGMYIFAVIFGVMIIHFPLSLNLRNTGFYKSLLFDDLYILDAICMSLIALYYIQIESNFSMLIGKIIIILVFRFFVLKLYKFLSPR